MVVTGEAISRQLGLDVTGAGEGPGGQSLSLGLAYRTRVAAWSTRLGLWDALPARTRSGRAAFRAGRQRGRHCRRTESSRICDMGEVADSQFATDLYSIYT